jgi:hypothetical protein
MGLGERPLATLFCPPLCPIRGIELDIHLEVLRKLLLPCLHQAFVPFGDEQQPVRLAVAVMVLVNDEAWTQDEELYLG